MGKYKKKIKEAIEILDKIDSKSENFQEDKQKAFIKVHKIIDNHVNSELKEKKDFDNLRQALENYRKHLDFAKNILDNKVPEECLNEEDLKTLKRLNREPFNSDNDYKFVRNQLELALKEHHFIKQNLANLIKEEKIRLE